MAEFEYQSDGRLVASYLDGDQSALADIYDRYSDRIYSYCLTMLRQPDDAADAAHDTFVKAATRLGQLDDPEKLRAWLFTIARNEAHGTGRHRARVTPEEDLSEAMVDDPDLAMSLKQAELRELVWAAADGLGERDRELMSLHLVEGLEGDDLADAMEVAPSHLHVMVSRMKDRVEKAMGALLIARLGSEDCEELPGVLGDWDGSFDMAVRSRVTRHVEGCDVCTERRAFLLAPANVLPGIMLVPAPKSLRKRFLASTKTSAKTSPLHSSPWVKVGAFAAVAIVVGLVGAAVSAQFEPSSFAPTIPAVASDSTTTTSPVSENQGPTTSVTINAGSLGTTTIPTPADPATFQVSTTAVDFGPGGTSGEFEISNSGGSAGSFSLGVSTTAISLSTGSGELGAGESLAIQMSLDRGAINEGELDETVTISWDGGQIEIGAIGIHEDNPIIHNPQASPSELFFPGSAPPCGPQQTTVSARVRDTSELTSVVAQWGGTETAMTHVGDDIFEATIGPFTSAQTAPVRIVGTDEFGNAGGATVEVVVTACT